MQRQKCKKFALIVCLQWWKLLNTVTVWTSWMLIINISFYTAVYKQFDSFRKSHIYFFFPENVLLNKLFLILIVLEYEAIWRRRWRWSFYHTGQQWSFLYHWIFTHSSHRYLFWLIRTCAVYTLGSANSCIGIHILSHFLMNTFAWFSYSKYHDSR